MKAIIIDDDTISLKRLENKLSKIPSIDLVDQANSLSEGIKKINKHKPDLVLLDIEMPQYSGLDIFEFYDDPNFEIVCCTAYPEYAIKALKKSVFDYLLKPIQDIELKETIDRLKKTRTKKRKAISSIHPDQISLLTNNGYELFEINKIIHIRTNGSYSSVNLEGVANAIVSTKPLSYFEEILRSNNFVRINRQDLVNFRFVKKLKKGRYPILELKNGSQLLVSDRKRALIRSIFTQ